MTPEEFCDLHAPCVGGRMFALQYQTMAEVWDNCQRSDWLLWIAIRTVERPSDATLRKLACRFIRETKLADGRTVWDLLTDERSRNAVIVAERHARGTATDAEIATAYAAADAAAYDIAYDYGSAADVAYAARSAAAYAATIYAYDYAAYDYTIAAASSSTRAAACDAANAQLCTIIRSEIPNPFRIENDT